jgi:adenylate cyclase class 2
MPDQELEVKYLVSDLAKLEQRLQTLGALQESPRTHEVNLRFDTPDGALEQGKQVLRLRQDQAIHLTYKGPASSQQGVRVRTEIEFGVDDFEKARRFLEALGYQVALMYEKYRTTYALEGVEILLDELPFGSFVEIEGSNPQVIRAVNDRLGLDWSKRAPESYIVIFETLKAGLELPFRDLSFENFSNLKITPAILDLHPADLPPATP